MMVKIGKMAGRLETKKSLDDELSNLLIEIGRVSAHITAVAKLMEGSVKNDKQPAYAK